jgi:hypothetical protein
VTNFVRWLDTAGESSYDHQSYYAGPIGRRAKALYYRHRWCGALAVAPMVASEALWPQGRRLFHHRMRLPIADAHYAMGFRFLSQAYADSGYAERSLDFLEILLATRCPDYPEYCWGYPFDWVTRNGTIKAGTPLITTTPYVYEALLQCYHATRDERWLPILGSIIRHAMTDIRDFSISPRASTCSYTPFDGGGVVNAAAYRSFMLTSASVELGCPGAGAIALRNLQFVLDSQCADGSWFYAVDGHRNFIDHFHTCFVLKALAKIQRLSPTPQCHQALDKGLAYYLANLLDSQRLPKPFARAPRLTVYRRELYDYAECINLCLLLRRSHSELNQVLQRLLEDLSVRWVKRDGSFRSRELLFGWDNVPMHRWGQSQMFRSLACFCWQENGGDRAISSEAGRGNVAAQPDLG